MAGEKAILHNEPTTTKLLKENNVQRERTTRQERDQENSNFRYQNLPRGIQEVVDGFIHP